MVEIALRTRLENSWLRYRTVRQTDR